MADSVQSGVTVLSEAAATMADQMDRLLASGWSIVTSQNKPGWPDTWSLTRRWKPSDPENYPTDGMHQFEYGQTTIRDDIGFTADGGAIARRFHLVDKSVLWEESGPADTLVAKAMTLSAPDECLLVERESELLWGPATTRVLAAFRTREWQLSFVPEFGGSFDYQHGVGTAELDRPRFYQGQEFEPLGICRLSCEVTPELDVRVTGWRVQTGCVAHRALVQSVGFDDARLGDVLSRFETAATTVDLPALAYCVLYGDCSSRELDLSAEDPTLDAVEADTT